SPDGRSVVFAADNPQRLLLRSLESGSTRELPGTDGAYLPFWSPDGRSVGFFQSRLNKVRSIDVDRDSVQDLADFRVSATEEHGIGKGRFFTVSAAEFIDFLRDAKSPQLCWNELRVRNFSPTEIISSTTSLLRASEAFISPISRDHLRGFSSRPTQQQSL